MRVCIRGYQTTYNIYQYIASRHSDLLVIYRLSFTLQCFDAWLPVTCLLYFIVGYVYDVVVKKVHVRYLISWWVSCFNCKGSSMRHSMSVPRSPADSQLTFYKYFPPMSPSPFRTVLTNFCDHFRTYTCRFFVFVSFHLCSLNRVIGAYGLSWFNQLLNCILNRCTFLSFLFSSTFPQNMVGFGPRMANTSD